MSAAKQAHLSCTSFPNVSQALEQLQHKQSLVTQICNTSFFTPSMALHIPTVAMWMSGAPAIVPLADALYQPVYQSIGILLILKIFWAPDNQMATCILPQAHSRILVLFYVILWELCRWDSLMHLDTCTCRRLPFDLQTDCFQAGS